MRMGVVPFFLDVLTYSTRGAYGNEEMMKKKKEIRIQPWIPESLM
jgi:hypothetical protein